MQGIPKGAAIAVADLLDHCARIQPGQEVVLLAHIDGLYGGDNLVDETAIAWIQAGVQRRGANASVLWIDEKAKPHAWRLPPVVKAVLASCDVLINHSFDLAFEEMVELKQYLWAHKKLMVRNFATTAPLLCTAWAQTPHELVSEIRYQASVPFKEGLPWQARSSRRSMRTTRGSRPTRYGARKAEAIGPGRNGWFRRYGSRRLRARSFSIVCSAGGQDISASPRFSASRSG